MGHFICVLSAGDHCGVLCKGLKLESVKRGIWLTEPGTVQLRNLFRAEGYLLSKEEGGRDQPLRSGFTQKIMCTTWDQACRVLLPTGTDMLMPGDNGMMWCCLLKPMPLEVGCKFTLTDKGRDTILTGVVTELLPNVEASTLDDLSNLKVEGVENVKRRLKFVKSK